MCVYKTCCRPCNCMPFKVIIVRQNASEYAISRHQIQKFSGEGKPLPGLPRTALPHAFGTHTSVEKILDPQLFIYFAGGTVHQTFNARRLCLPSGFSSAWNSLPSSVRNAPSLTTFRRELKTLYFRSSFDND